MIVCTDKQLHIIYLKDLRTRETIDISQNLHRFLHLPRFFFVFSLLYCIEAPSTTQLSNTLILAYCLHNNQSTLVVRDVFRQNTAFVHGSDSNIRYFALSSDGVWLAIAYDDAGTKVFLLCSFPNTLPSFPGFLFSLYL